MADKKEAVKETVEKAVEAAKTEAAAVKETAKKATRKTASTAKKTAAAAKKTAKKAVEKVEEKKAAAKKDIIQIQFGGKDLSVESVVAAVKADFKSKNKGTIKSVEIYIKPEDNKAYYVVNGIADEIDL